jgi:hypothetical protein
LSSMLTSQGMFWMSIGTLGNHIEFKVQLKK